MSLTYATFVSSFANLLEYDSGDAVFATMLPNAIDYAEQRIYRDFDPVAQIERDSTASLTIGDRTFTLPTSIGNFRAVTGFNIITPAGTAAATGTRNPATSVSRDVLDILWPSNSANKALPTLYAVLDNNTVLVGPSPDAAYVVEVVGKVRPAALSATNTTTYLTTFYPDLFLCAAMIFGAGFKANYGAQSDDPKQAVSWESQYTTLLQSALAEEGRRRTDS